MVLKFKNPLTLYSWAFYDFANTIFSAVVLTFYFPLYLTGLTQKNLYLGLATTGAMILAGLVVPWLGALSDRTGRTKSFLIATTVLCVIFILGLSFFQNVRLLIGSFLFACFFFHASLVFYYALLPVVAGPKEQGFASGVGTALGYLGVLVSIPLAHLVDSLYGRRFVFLVAAAGFFLFALPLFRWVPERRVQNPVVPSAGLLGSEWKKVFQTVRSLGKKPDLLLFFLGNFFVMDAVNTVTFWLVIYLARVFHPPQIYLILVFLGLNAAAFIFGLLAGPLTDRWGASRVVKAAALSLFVTIVTLGLTRNFWIFIGVGLTGGAFSFSGMWTAARKRVVELAPEEAVGEYFGLYNLTTKISVAGSLVFSLLADRFGFQAALLSQALSAGLGVLCFAAASRRSASRYPSS